MGLGLSSGGLLVVGVPFEKSLTITLRSPLLLLLLLLPSSMGELFPPVLLMLIFRRLLLPLRCALSLRLRSSQLSDMSNNSPQFRGSKHPTSSLTIPRDQKFEPS